MNLKTDFAFKTVFGGEKNKALLISFLNEVLKGLKKIVSIEHLQLEQLGRRKEDRKAIFDLYCTDENQEHHIIEMQVAQQRHFMDRCLFYATFPIQKQAEKGNWDYELKPLYVISILDFILWNDNDNCFNYHSLMNEETLTKSSDKLQFITVELPKFNKSASELTSDLDNWLFCMKHLSDLPEQPSEIKGEVFDELFELTEIEKLTHEDMEIYDKSVLKYAGNKLAMDYARDKGFEDGLEKGMQKGMQRGVQKGIFQTAQNLRTLGMSMDLIAKATGLTPKQIQKIMGNP